MRCAIAKTLPPTSFCSNISTLAAVCVVDSPRTFGSVQVVEGVPSILKPINRLKELVTIVVFKSKEL